MARVLSAAEKRAAKKERKAQQRAAQLKKKRRPPQSDVQGHLALLDGVFRAMKQPRTNSRTVRCEKTRGPLNWNGGRRGKNKTNGKALLRAALSAV